MITKNSNPLLTAKDWLFSKRLKYNKGLITSGFIAFILYCSLEPIFIEPHEEFEETIFEMAFQGMFYLIMILIANVFYSLGWLLDMWFNHKIARCLEHGYTH